MEAAGNLGRFQEFSSSDGDKKLQDILVDQLTLTIRRAQSSEAMEERIEIGMADAADAVHDLYSKTTRKLDEEHENLAKKTALPQLAQWNRAIIAHSKATAAERILILKELDDVNKLLRRTPLQPRKGGRNSKTNNSDIFQSALGLAYIALMLNTFEGIAVRDNGPTVLGEFGGLSLILVLLGVHVHNTTVGATWQEKE